MLFILLVGGELFFDLIFMQDAFFFLSLRRSSHSFSILSHSKDGDLLSLLVSSSLSLLLNKACKARLFLLHATL